MLISGFSPRTRALLGQVFRFCTVGVLNTLVSLLVIYSFMLFFKYSVGFANVIGYAVGLICSFILNWIWTFKSKQSIFYVLPKYLLGFVVSYLVNLCVVLFMATVVNPYLSQIFGMAAYSIVFFFVSRFFVFSSKKNECSV